MLEELDSYDTGLLDLLLVYLEYELDILKNQRMQIRGK